MKTQPANITLRPLLQAIKKAVKKEGVVNEFKALYPKSSSLNNVIHTIQKDFIDLGIFTTSGQLTTKGISNIQKTIGLSKNAPAQDYANAVVAVLKKATGKA